jgi:hypothetical protein
MKVGLALSLAATAGVPNRLTESNARPARPTIAGLGEGEVAFASAGAAARCAGRAGGASVGAGLAAAAGAGARRRGEEGRAAGDSCWDVARGSSAAGTSWYAGAAGWGTGCGCCSTGEEGGGEGGAAAVGAVSLGSGSAAPSGRVACGLSKVQVAFAALSQA